MAIVERALEPSPSDLDERHALALAFADALMTRPDALDPSTVAALRRAYTDAELVELTLKVLAFNSQKVNVTLGTHRWIASDELGAQRWNADGRYVAADPR